MHFDYHIPTKIIFGRGRLKELATEELPGSKALIVITNGQSMKRLGYLNQVTQYLKENGVDSVLFDKVLPNPTLAHVSEAAELARREKLRYGCRSRRRQRHRFSQGDCVGCDQSRQLLGICQGQGS